MLLTITPLSPNIVNLIAAGEVIDSPMAVIRELVENSLDAQANQIDIKIFPHIWRIQVTDNGTGISTEDLKLAARPHSTSKIQQLSDLWKITSLGFRGEALHSIAQVADLSISTRTREEIGGKVTYHQNGEIKSHEQVAIAFGTIVTVSRLFANWPVRRSGLPKFSQQFKSIQALIYDFAICYPYVTWQIWQDDRLWFSISPARDRKALFPQMIRGIHLGDLQALQEEIKQNSDSEDKIESEVLNYPSRLELVLGLPDRCHRHRPDWVKVAINGRVVKIPALENTLINGFSRTLPRDRFPLCFLHLNVHPSQIDWNRHPAKREIYLHSLEFWQEKIKESLEKALRLNPDTLSVKVQNERVTKLLKASEEKGTYTITPQEKSGNQPQLLNLKVIAQVSKTYIVTEHENGLWLVEQHIAHERVLYERLQDQWKIIPLSTPIILKQLTHRQVEQLQALNLSVESFGENLWAVRNAPEALAKREDCQDALLELSNAGDLETAQVATACRTAIRNGTPLSLPEMETLIEQWKNTRNPNTCPHGRPIYLSLEESALSRFFRRHWVIGKSHGILEKKND
ncbi:MAG: DNA mismatch repair endonuclease MutL [Microcystaceae cyanobacterium]